MTSTASTSASFNTTSSAAATGTVARNLAGKVAFVTGGSRGIGAAIVRRLARDGAAVAFSYQNAAATADALVSEIHAQGGRALALKIDSADAVALAAGIQQAAAQFGALDILVNSAGVLLLGPVDTLSLADFDRTLAVNVRAVFVATQTAVALMQRGGRVVNIGSTNADRMPFAGGSAYAMSKSALQGLVQGLARDLGPRGITINNVQPGPVNTEMNPADGPFADTMRGLMAIPQYGSVEDIAGMVAYLVGPEGGYVTGASLTIDGGFAA